MARDGDGIAAPFQPPLQPCSVGIVEQLSLKVALDHIFLGFNLLSADRHDLRFGTHDADSMDSAIPLSKDQRAIDHINIPRMTRNDIERDAHTFFDAVDDHFTVFDSSAGLIEITAIIGASLISEQLIAAPDFAVVGLAFIGGNEQNLDLDVDIRFDDEIFAFDR